MVATESTALIKQLWQMRSDHNNKYVMCESGIVSYVLVRLKSALSRL